MRSTRLWERGCEEHGKMWRNVIPGQCEARNSVLPLGTRPQAVCFCRDTLNHPCTYVNTEHRDTHSQHSERSLWTAEAPRPSALSPSAFLFKILSMKSGGATHKYICENSNTPPPPPTPAPHRTRLLSVNSLQLFPERPMNSLVSAFQRYVFRSSIFWCSVLLGSGLRFHLSKFRSSCSRGWCSANSSCSSSSSWPCLRMTLGGWRRQEEEKKPSPHMFSTADLCSLQITAGKRMACLLLRE